MASPLSLTCIASTGAPIFARIRRDSEWQVWKIALTIDGYRMRDADAEEETKADAISTAHAMVTRAEREWFAKHGA